MPLNPVFRCRGRIKHDIYVGSRIAERRSCTAAFDPGVDFRVIEGARHRVMYERPDAVNRALLENLTR